MRCLSSWLMLMTAVSWIGCEARSLHYDPVSPVEGEATQITLEIYGDGDGTLRETRIVDAEGPVLVEVTATR